jgi:hypothetical protein
MAVSPTGLLPKGALLSSGSDTRNGTNLSISNPVFSAGLDEDEDEPVREVSTGPAGSQVATREREQAEGSGLDAETGDPAEWDTRPVSGRVRVHHSDPVGVRHPGSELDLTGSEWDTLGGWKKGWKDNTVGWMVRSVEMNRAQLDEAQENFKYDPVSRQEKSLGIDPRFPWAFVYHMGQHAHERSGMPEGTLPEFKHKQIWDDSDRIPLECWQLCHRLKRSHFTWKHDFSSTGEFIIVRVGLPYKRLVKVHPSPPLYISLRSGHIRVPSSTRHSYTAWAHRRPN